MRIRIILILIIAIAGCAGYESPAYRQEEMRGQYLLDSSLAESCFEDLVLDPALAPIKDKVFLGNTKDQGFTYLTLTSKPTDADQPLLLDWARKRDNCINKNKEFFDKWSSQIPQQIIALASSVSATQQAMLADLYNGEMTYGDFAKKRADLLSNFQSASAQITDAVRQRNYESAQRAQELSLEYQRNIIMQQQANQERFNQIRSHTLNCMTYGNQTNCSGD